ncbi:MAG: hypothetical protein H7289_07905 [Mucilaginibacter sp.]|nr:hypothetical protein [Mucilaginibacter sp.]
MNNTDFSQTGGFPFDQGTLAFMQNNIVLASKAAAMGGTLSIISGCEIAGVNATSGFVFINGEILPFVAGTITAKVIIVETTTSLLYQDNVSRPVQKVRHATFGDDGVTDYLWVNFKRNTSEGVLARLERLERIAAPILTGDGWLLFNRPANQIPPQWAEVVEMRGRTAIHQDVTQTEFVAIGQTGGNKNKTLSIDEMPAHKHTLTGGLVGQSYSANGGTTRNSIDSANPQTENTGGGVPFGILNPYRIVLYIKYVGA